MLFVAVVSFCIVIDVNILSQIGEKKEYLIVK